MPEQIDEQIENFLTLFNGDIAAAHHALNEHSHKKQSIPEPIKISSVANTEIALSIQNVSKKYARQATC